MKTTDARKKEILEKMKGGLIVSCQVQHDDPIYTDDMVVKMAEAARWGGAVGKQPGDFKRAGRLVRPPRRVRGGRVGRVPSAGNDARV